MTNLGVDNNNPTNIQYTGIGWQGLANPPHDKTGFCVFVNADAGLRAGARNLHNQQSLHKLDTISAIVNKLSPPEENDTAAYIVNVARRMNVGPTAVLDLNSVATLASFLSAVVEQEVGAGHYMAQQYHEAACAALGQPIIATASQVDPVAPPPVVAAPAAKVSSAVTAGGTIGAATLVPFVTWAMGGFAGQPPANSALLIAAGLASLAHLLYNRLTHD